MMSSSSTVVMASTATFSGMSMAGQTGMSGMSSMMGMTTRTISTGTSSAMRMATTTASMISTSTMSSMASMSMSSSSSMNMSDSNMFSDSYDNMKMPPIPTSSLWSPRISPEAYVAIQFLAMAIATVTAMARTYLRIKKFRRVTLDDALLSLAVCFLIIGVAVNYLATSMTYWTTYVNLDLVGPPPGWGDMLAGYALIDNVSDVFGWGAICTVKISFLVFLRGLVKRLRFVRVWWWIVFAFTAMSTPVTMFLGFYVCHTFTGDPTEYCDDSLVVRQFTFLCVNCVLDILSDALILTIPCWLIWQVQISSWRKVALALVLCLSVVMICIALIRVTMYGVSLPNGVTGPDTTWLYFWTNLEGAVAIIMVSLAAFRSMLGQEGVGKNESPNSTRSKADKHASCRESRDYRASANPYSTWQRWSEDRQDDNSSFLEKSASSDTTQKPTRHIAEQWIDPRINSIRKEITIRTDYESLNHPANVYRPRSVETGDHLDERVPQADVSGTYLLDDRSA